MKNFKQFISGAAKAIAAATIATLSLVSGQGAAQAQAVDPANPWGFEKKAYKPDGTPWSGPVNVGDTVKYVLSYKPGATNSGPVTIDDTLSPNQSYIAPTKSSPGWTWGSSPYASGNHEQYVNPGFGPGAGSVKLTVTGVPAPSSGEGDGTAPIPIPSLNKVFGVFHHAEDMTTPKYQMKIGCWNLNDLNPCATPSANNGGLHTPIWPQAVVRGQKFFFPGILGGTVSGHALVGPVAIGCFDGAVSPSGAACGTTLVGVNAGLGQFGGVVEDSSGNLLIAVLDRLYCFKESSGSLSTCPSWPTSGFVSVSPTPSSPTAWNNTTSQVYLLSDPTNVIGRVYVGHGSGVVQCVQTSGTPSLCPGWPVAGVQPAGASHGISLHSIPNGGGGDGGVCLWDIAGTLSGCVDANGSAIAASAPANVVAYVPIPFRFPNSNKVYFPSHNATHGPKCVSYTGASGTPCPGFTSAVPAGFTNKTLQYGVAIDPTKPEKCMLALGDESLLWRFDYTTGEPGCGTTTVSTLPIESFYCNGKPDPANFKWTGFSVTTPGASGTLLVKQGSTTVYNGIISSSVTNFSLAAAGAAPLTVTFIPAAGKPATVDVSFIYTSDKNPQICYQAKVTKCGEIVSNEAVLKGTNGTAPISVSRKVDLGVAKGPECDTVPPVSVSCLKGDTKVTCGAKPGTFVITLSPSGPGGIVPATVQVTSLTPGVTIVSPASSYPVVAGHAYITVAGANPGDVVDLQVDASSSQSNPETGLSICCNGKVSVTIPKDLDCKEKTPIDVAVKKTGATTPEPSVGAYSFALALTNEGAAFTPASGVLTVTDVVPAGMTFNSITGSAGWTCLPATAAVAGTPITCTFAGGALAAGPAAPIGTINIVATASGSAPFPPFTNCADIGTAANAAVKDTKLPNNHSCVTVKKPDQSTVSVKKVCEPAINSKYALGPAIDAAGWHANCKITVTTTGPQSGTLSVADNMTGGGTFASASSATTPAWTCTATGCSMPGAALNQTTSTSVINVLVTFPNKGSISESQNCAAVAVDGKKAGKDCTKFTVVEEKTGTLTVIKDARYNGQHITNIAFPIAVTCGTTVANATVTDGTPYVQTGIPLNTSCAVVETPGPGPACPQGTTGGWLTSYDPSAPVAVTAAGATVTIHNQFSCGDILPKLSMLNVQKVVISHAELPLEAMQFSVTSNCTGNATPTLTQPLLDGETKPFQAYTPGTSCTVQEATPALTGACGKMTPRWTTTYLPSATASNFANGTTITVQNTLDCDCPHDGKLVGGVCATPLEPVQCDPATATQAGDLCRCRFDNMQQTSKTSCACKDGFDLVKGKGCFKPEPKCDGVTAKVRGGACTCIYRNMTQASETSCGCGKGTKFVKGKGCLPIEPLCPNGTKFNAAHNRCEPVCGKGQVYNAKRNRCDTLPPACKRNQHNDPKTGKCVSNEPVCRAPYKYNAKINKCVQVLQPRGNKCPFPLVPNPLNGRCIDPSVIIDLFGNGGGDPSGPKDNGPVNPGPKVCRDGDVVVPCR